MSVKKIKGAARQCYGDGDGVVWCEQTFRDIYLYRLVIIELYWLVRVESYKLVRVEL